jgi:hypothetical protein
MSIVYVIQSTKFQSDVSPAAVYGSVEFVLGPQDRTSHSPEIVLSKLRKCLRDFDPVEDYILWAGGDPLSLMLVGSVLADMGFTEWRYLRYERGSGKNPESTPFYVPVKVRL